MAVALTFTRRFGRIVPGRGDELGNIPALDLSRLDGGPGPLVRTHIKENEGADHNDADDYE